MSKPDAYHQRKVTYLPLLLTMRSQVCKYACTKLLLGSVLCWTIPFPLVVVHSDTSEDASDASLSSGVPKAVY